jgi:hypothetical protein
LQAAPTEDRLKFKLGRYPGFGTLAGRSDPHYIVLFMFFVNVHKNCGISAMTECGLKSIC